MHRLLAAAVLLLLLTAACAAPDGEEDGVTVLPEDAAAGEDAAPLPELGVEGGELTGTLGGDPELEGGCAWLALGDGTRYEVVYPTGWEVRTDPVELRDPQGEIVAEEGDEVTLAGSVQEDQVSFCQIGPIFVATEVET